MSNLLPTPQFLASDSSRTSSIASTMKFTQAVETQTELDQNKMMTIEKDIVFLRAFKRQVESDTRPHGLDIGFLFASPLIYKE